MITKLTLQNFRKFQKLELDITKPIVVIHGDNAKGKSSILEAIHIIANGNSPWASSDEYLNNKQEDTSKHMRIEIQTDEKTYTFYKDGRKRKHQIDGVNTTSRNFFSKNSATIFNPEQIEILMISPSKRRDFLDSVIKERNYEYDDIQKKYKKVLRQRNAYLKKLSKLFYEKGIIARNDPQLNFWSKEFITLAEIIRKERQNLVTDIKTKDFWLEYEIPEYETEDIAESLELSKKRDIATGRTNIGPHRDDWQIFNDENIKKFGSRGQKRLTIGRLIFQTQEILAKDIGYYPILLLDDISSELDKKNTNKIFSKDTLEKQQTFITIIEKKDIPKEVLDEAQLIDLNNLKLF